MYRNTLALSFEEMGMLDSAYSIIEKELLFLKMLKKVSWWNTLSDLAKKGFTFGNLGGALAKLEQGQEAEKVSEKACHQFQTSEFDRRDVQTAKVKLTEL